jgi:hypothetical protein
MVRVYFERVVDADAMLIYIPQNQSLGQNFQTWVKMQHWKAETTSFLYSERFENRSINKEVTGTAISSEILSHARDQRFPTYKLRICEIGAKIPRQNHFRIRTLIFPSVQCLSDSVHYHQRNKFRKKLTKFDPWRPAIERWYPGVV